jgi:hypothetical protein
MSINRTLAAIVICGVVALVPSSLGARGGQAAQGGLAEAKTIKCAFPLMAVGKWGAEKAEAQVQPAPAAMQNVQFESINADEGTAELKSPYGGKYDIIVRYSKGYLHFVQMFLDGPLYSTTILEKKTASGKLKAMHSRHEHTDVAMAGWTSSPEQYYGECEVIN